MKENLDAIIAKHREWTEKYSNASEEERERMLAEKKAERERYEREQEQRIYNERKARFMEQANAKIESLSVLIPAHKTAMSIVKNFDGKVLNNRLTKAVDAELKKLNDRIYCSLTIEYDYQEQVNVGRLRVEFYNLRANVRMSFTIKILLTKIEPFTSNGDRVRFADTESLDLNNVEVLMNQIAVLKDAIKSYDKAYRAAKKVEEQIVTYAKENYHLRDFFRAENVIGKCYYI